MYFSYTWIYILNTFGEYLKTVSDSLWGNLSILYKQKHKHKPLSCWFISNLVVRPVRNWDKMTSPGHLHLITLVSCAELLILIPPDSWKDVWPYIGKVVLNLSSPKLSIVGGYQDSTSCKLKHVSTLSTGSLELCWDGADRATYVKCT